MLPKNDAIELSKRILSREASNDVHTRAEISFIESFNIEIG